jgi:hypothetical protein
MTRFIRHHESKETSRSEVRFRRSPSRTCARTQSAKPESAESVSPTGISWHLMA